MEATAAGTRLIRATDLDFADGRRAQRAVQSGRLVTVVHGVFVRAEDWAPLSDRERHVLRVRALLPKLPDRSMIADLSAAAVLGWPRIGSWPARVHVVEPGTLRDVHRSTYTVHHGERTTEPPSMLLDGVPVASVVETAIRLAGRLPFLQAVVLLDHVLRTGAATPEALTAALPPRPGRGSVRAARAVEFACAVRESVGESFTAVRLEEAGAPRPVPQHEFWYPDGTHDRVDFWFPQVGIVLEFDGKQKYVDPAMLRGRDPAEALWLEKLREDRIRARPEVAGVSRIVWAELFDPDRFRATLRGAGIPCR